MEPGTIHNECSNEYCANENQPGIVKKIYYRPNLRKVKIVSGFY